MAQSMPPNPSSADEAGGGGRDRLFLIDGSALAYRSYFAFERTQLMTSKGEPTGAVFGFANTLWGLIREYRPRYLAVVFDTAEPTFRHVEYEHYKAHREEMPADLVRQLPIIDRLVAAWPLKLLAQHGVEADDIMGSYARQLGNPELEVVLVSGDKDFCQLVGPHVSILNLGRGGTAKVEAHWLDAAGVTAKMGVPPAQIIELLSLMGDSADNVPGIPGFGEKTAATLIRQFGDLETLLASIDQVPRKSWQEKLREHAELARLSRRLVTIDTDLPLPARLEELRVPPPAPSLVAFFREMEFSRLLREAESVVNASGAGGAGGPNSPATAPATALDAPANGAPAELAAVTPTPPAATPGSQRGLFDSPEAADAPTAAAPPAGPWLEAAPPADGDYRLVTTEAELTALAAELSTCAAGIAIDTETTGVDPMRARLVGLSFATHPRRAFYVPVGHTAGPNLSLELVRRVLGPILADPAVPKVGQNLKYDLVVLDRHELPVRGSAFDTMVASYLIDAERSHKLDNLAHDLLGYRMIPISDVIGKGAKQRSFADVPLELACRYSAEDADITLRLRDWQAPKLAEAGLTELFHTLEMPLLEILKEMEETGIALDVPFLAAMSERLGEEMRRLEALAHEAAGAPFNLNSPVQLAQILFERLKLPTARKTKTGYSTDSEVLEDLAPQHPLPRLVLEYRQLMKLKGTYVDALPRLIHPDTGRVHTSFNQAVAATGRLSSSDPNLQNIPIRTPLGREVRRAFVAGARNLLLISADYSQIELRLMAHLSKDERLVDYFHRGVDVHRETAASIFGASPADVTNDQRAAAKTVNFGIMYGQGPVGLARQIGITQAEATRFIAAYRAQFPGVTRFLEQTVAEARRTGFVSTLLKRRRYLPNLLSQNGRLRAEAERMAINTPIQGTAADLIKSAMIVVHRELKERFPRAKLLLQVHDELVLEAPAPEAQPVAVTVKEAMEQALQLDVPVVVEVGVGHDWAGIH